jgi:hypothetical protein
VSRRTPTSGRAELRLIEGDTHPGQVRTADESDPALRGMQNKRPSLRLVQSSDWSIEQPRPGALSHHHKRARDSVHFVVAPVALGTGCLAALLIVGIAAVVPLETTSSIGTLAMLVVGLNSIFGGFLAEALLRRTRREW